MSPGARVIATPGSPSNMTVDPGRVTAWLRLEGLMAGLLSVGAYTLLSLGGWIFFALLFLLPDVSMAGYLANTRE